MHLCYSFVSGSRLGPNGETFLPRYLLSQVPPDLGAAFYGRLVTVPRLDLSRMTEVQQKQALRRQMVRELFTHARARSKAIISYSFLFSSFLVRRAGKKKHLRERLTRVARCPYAYSAVPTFVSPPL